MLRYSVFLFLTLSWNSTAQWVWVRNVPEIAMPSQVDSNSPAFWLNGELHLFNSTGDGPLLSRGRDQFSLTTPERSTIARQRPWPAWIEAVWVDEQSGAILAWYHQERENLCGAQRPAQPHIGAAISYDSGKTFFDQGVILSSPVAPDCSSKNGYFSGGHGDFSVVLDRDKHYFYFMFGNYGGPSETQGVSIARMAYEDRFHPVNSVWKYNAGSWDEPGVSGRVSPLLAATVNWQSENTDSFWGPSVHWNKYLRTYVMLLNRSCCSSGFPQRGIYISYNPDLSDPNGWTRPRRILSDSGWYPQVLGVRPGETDSVAGRFARLYIYGRSRWELVFFREEEAEAPPANP